MIVAIAIFLIGCIAGAVAVMATDIIYDDYRRDYENGKVKKKK